MSNDPSSNRPPSTPRSNMGQRIQLTGVRVLLVETDGDQLAGLAGRLEDAGAEIDTATWAEDAIVLLS